MVLPGKINSFTANTIFTTVGKPVTLTWSTSNCTAPTLNGSSVSPSGSKTFYPTTSTTYTLKAYSEAGGQTQSINVTITGIPVPVPPPPTPPPPTPPAIICTPGALKCIGVDLYVCNTSGTAWTLKTANSPTCKAGGTTPDFWTDPVGWVIGTITKAWEAMLGFVSGQFNIFLQNIKNFQNNFMTQLVAFIKDPITALKGWLTGVFLSVALFVLEFTKNITVWWTVTQTIVKKWIDDAIGAIGDFAKIFATLIGAFWQTALIAINALIAAAMSGINAFISGFGAAIDAIRKAIMVAVSALISIATSAFRDILNFSIKELYDLIIKYINEFIELIVGGFFEGFTIGINESGQSPLDVEKETDNPILRDLQNYVKNYRIERDKKKVR